MTTDDQAAVEAIAKAICQEDCAFRGEPACWNIDPGHWPPPTCDEPGCMAYARAAFFAMPKPRPT